MSNNKINPKTDVWWCSHNKNLKWIHHGFTQAGGQVATGDETIVSFDNEKDLAAYIDGLKGHGYYLSEKEKSDV